jgi:hypothetical protein
MSLIAPNGTGPSPDAADATRSLLDLAHAALPSAELAGVLVGTTRAATQLLEPGASAPAPSAPSAATLSGAGRAYLAVIEEVLAGAALGHGPHTAAARELHRALDDHAEDVAARPRGAAVPVTAGHETLVAGAGPRRAALMLVRADRSPPRPHAGAPHPPASAPAPGTASPSPSPSKAAA